MSLDAFSRLAHRLLQQAEQQVLFDHAATVRQRAQAPQRRQATPARPAPRPPTPPPSLADQLAALAQEVYARRQAPLQPGQATPATVTPRTAPRPRAFSDIDAESIYRFRKQCYAAYRQTPQV